MILGSLNVLLDKKANDETVWSYLVRYLIQPQVMTPREISHAMKGQQIDGPIKSARIEEIKNENLRIRKYLNEIKVEYFPSITALDNLRKLMRWKEHNDKSSPKKKIPYSEQAVNVLEALNKFTELEGARALDTLRALEFNNAEIYRR